MADWPHRFASDAELARAAAGHAALVCRLERLVDCGAQGAARPEAQRGDRIGVNTKDVVQVRAHGRWRYGLVTAESGGAGVWVAYLVPSALDQAQRIWVSRSLLMLDSGYPAHEAEKAQLGHTDPHSAEVAASEAFKDAVFFQAVAVGCPRRPWAALVPVHRVMRHAHEVYRATNQRLGTAEHDGF